MNEITNVTILGSGQMGAGIGLVCAIHDYNVVFYDVKEEFVNNGIERNKKWIKRQVEKNKLSKENAELITQKMSGTISLEAAVSNSDLIIEAIIENLDIKKELWAKVANFAPEHTIFGSNTSSLSISEMAKASKRPSKFLGTHFFNPPVILKLIEFIQTTHTSEETMNIAIQFGQTLGMDTVKAKETPGFIVNRLLIPQLNEAYLLLENDIASKEDIDTAMKIGLNHPMGPLTLSDFIGLDTILYIAEYLHKHLGPKYKPADILYDLVNQGKMGRKSGEGFYTYN